MTEAETWHTTPGFDTAGERRARHLTVEPREVDWRRYRPAIKRGQRSFIFV